MNSNSVVPAEISTLDGVNIMEIDIYGAQIKRLANGRKCLVYRSVVSTKERQGSRLILTRDVRYWKPDGSVADVKSSRMGMGE